MRTKFRVTVEAENSNVISENDIAKAKTLYRKACNLGITYKYSYVVMYLYFYGMQLNCDYSVSYEAVRFHHEKIN